MAKDRNPRTEYRPFDPDIIDILQSAAPTRREFRVITVDGQMHVVEVDDEQDGEQPEIIGSPRLAP